MEVSGKKEFKSELTIKFESIEEVKALKKWLHINQFDISNIRDSNQIKEYQHVIIPIYKALDDSIRDN